MPRDDAKALEKKRAAIAARIEKQAAKRSDPAFKAAQQQKKVAAQERARERQRVKMADPAYRAEQAEKSRKAVRDQLARKKAKAAEARDNPQPPAPKKPRRKAKQRGMPGRTPTASERRYMDAIGKLPCICCHLRGRTNRVISLHHTDGRTKPDAHKKTLPLCMYHHDVPADEAMRELYPDLIPIHAKGNFGGPGQWRAEFGAEAELLGICYELAGLTPPGESLN